MRLAWPIMKDLLELRDRLNRWFDEAYLTPGTAVGQPTGGPFSPAVDLYETDDEVMVIMEVPGMEPGSVDLRRTGSTLRIAGRIRSSDGDRRGRFLRMERANGAFFRDLDLPYEDFRGEPEAGLEHGVLTIRLRMADPAPGRSGTVGSEDR